VPLQDTDRVRPSAILPAPRPWYLERPAELEQLKAPSGPRFGAAGPDLGYGLKLARRLADRIQLAWGEEEEDAVAGCFACGARRAAHFGRAPVVHDMEWAYRLWGYLGAPPADLIEWRTPRFRGAADHYWVQRQIVDAVRPETLPLTPAQVRERLESWKDLLIA
jgi:alkanesulfonate monooxygenase SsuD/methylene tetrahydromethanopterin reductase-like flavin-dependent oxidoreductase (luciferase family)